MSNGMAWWPGTGSLIGITTDNFSQLYKNSSPLYNCAGAPYIFAPKGDWPYTVSNPLNVMDLRYIDWSQDSANPTTIPINQSAYPSNIKASRIWTLFLESLNSFSEYSAAVEKTSINAPNIVSAAATLSNYDGILMNIAPPAPACGLLFDYQVTIKDISFKYKGNTYNTSDILKAYNDAWNNVQSYYNANAPGKNLISTSLNYWYIVGHANNSAFYQQFKGLNSLKDIVSPNSGLTYSGGIPSFNNSLATSATFKDRQSLPTDLTKTWFHYGIEEGDNFPGSTTSTRAWHSSTRQRGIVSSSGHHSVGYAGTISNGGVFQGNVPLQCPMLDSLAILPAFAVFPELYQCLIQSGPVWDYCKDKLSSDEKARLKLRPLVMAAEIMSIQMNKLFIMQASMKNHQGIPAGGLSAAGLQYAALIFGTIDAPLFINDSSWSQNAVWPNGQNNTTYPSTFVKCYNPLVPGIGFAHGFPIRLLWTSIDLGKQFDAMMGASTGSITGATAGMQGLGTVLLMVTFVDMKPGLKTINTPFVYNPSTVSPGVFIAESGITTAVVGDNKEVSVTASINGQDETNNTLGTWVIWPSSYSGMGSTKFFSRGQIQINFSAYTSLSAAQATSFLDFEFFFVPYGKGTSYATPADVIRDLKFARNDTAAIRAKLAKSGVTFDASSGKAGRTMYWEKESVNFPTIQAKNKILSPGLSRKLMNYSLNLYVDNFAPSSRTVTNSTDTGPYFSMDNIVIIMTVTAKCMLHKSNTPPIVTLNVQNNSITMPAKLIQSGFIGFEQRYYNKFSPPTGGSTAIGNLKMFIPPALDASLQENLNQVYSFIYQGFPDFSQMIALTPAGDYSTTTSIIVPAVAAPNVANASDNDLLPYFDNDAGAYFATPLSLLDMCFINGSPDLYWNLSMSLAPKIPQDNKAAKSINIAILGNAFFLTEDGTVYSVTEDSIVRTSISVDPKSNDQKSTVNFPIGPIVSQMTLLKPSILVINLKFLASDVSWPISIEKEGFVLDHGGTINKITASGPDGTVKGGQHVAYYRGLPICPATTLGSQEINFVMSDIRSFIISDTAPGSFLGAALSPIMQFPLTLPYGWIIESQGFGLQEILVAMIKSGATAIDKFEIDATATMGNQSLVSMDDIYANVNLLVNVQNITDGSSNATEIRFNGDSIVFDQIAICKSGEVEEKDSYSGILITTLKNNDHPYSTVYLFQTQYKIEQPYIDISSSKPYYFYDIDQINMCWDAFSEEFRLIGRHINGCLVLIRMNNDGLFYRPFRYIEGFLPVKDDQYNASIEDGGLQDDIVIDRYPFVPVCTGFFEARSGAIPPKALSTGSTKISKAPPLNTGSYANIASAIGQTQGVAVANGKAAVVTSNEGELFVFFAYDKHFQANSLYATCSPFLGRIYGMYSPNFGQSWTPPICVLNLSPFNPSNTITKMSYQDMINYYQSNIFVTSSDHSEYASLVSALASYNILTDNMVNTLAIEDIDADCRLYDNSIFLSFWYGGYICSIDVTSSANRMKNLYANMGNLLSDKFSPVTGVSYASLYKDTNYTEMFWYPEYNEPIDIVAGPITRIINYAQTGVPTPNVGSEPIVDSILKSYGYSSIIASATRNITDNGNTFVGSVRYDTYLKGVMPCNVNLLCSNPDYNVEQPPGKPALVTQHESSVSIVWKDTQGVAVIAHLQKGYIDRNTIGPFKLTL